MRIPQRTVTVLEQLINTIFAGKAGFYQAGAGFQEMACGLQQNTGQY
jgi:hypothetical protein